MGTEGQVAEHDVCPRCGASGLAHDPDCPNRRVPLRLPGVPGPPVLVSLTAALDALARVMDSQSLGEADDEYLHIAKAILAPTGAGGVRINIRDSVLVQLHVSDIRGANSISASISGLADAGHEEAAEALKNVAEAIANCTSLAAAQRSELLDLSEELSRQAALPTSERSKPGVIKRILTGLATGLGAAGGLAEVWSTWGSTIRAFFGV